MKNIIKSQILLLTVLLAANLSSSCILTSYSNKDQMAKGIKSTADYLNVNIFDKEIITNDQLSGFVKYYYNLPPENDINAVMVLETWPKQNLENGILVRYSYSDFNNISQNLERYYNIENGTVTELDQANIDFINREVFNKIKQISTDSEQGKTLGNLFFAEEINLYGSGEIGYAKTDFNNDKSLDLFVYFYNFFACGMQSNVQPIFCIKRGAEYKSIVLEDSVFLTATAILRQELFVMEQTTNGLHDLLMEQVYDAQKSPNSEIINRSIYQYDGLETYKKVRTPL